MKSIIEFYNRIVPKGVKSYRYYSDRDLSRLLIKRSQFDKQPIKILEIGSGIGTSKTLLTNQHFYIDSDISVQALRILKNIDSKFRGVCLNAEDLSFKDQSFSGVILIDVIEHCRNYQKAIKEIWRVLKPNGIALFQTNNKLFNLISNKGIHATVHPSLMFYGEFSQVLRIQGFTPNFIVPQRFSSFIISQVAKRKNLVCRILSSLPTGFFHPSFYPLFNVIAIKSQI
jgi:ubiquinone/menaquinone biosynthesis C-methylase UbiE